MIILALDDEEKPLRQLVSVIKEVRPEDEIHAFTGVKKALIYARDHEVDVAFLDIKMPEASGVLAAKKLLEFRPAANVIFTTNHKEYALDALHLYCSGYVLKPVSKEAVLQEFENLRHPKEEASKRPIMVRTFGSFDLFLNNKPMVFHKERAKEILAFLVDKRGSTATRKEIAATIFEDKEYTRSTQAYITNLFSYLRKCLAGYEVSELLVEGYNTYSINTDMIDCDFYAYMDGDDKAMDSFHGEYMTQYSWAEDRIYQFYE